MSLQIKVARAGYQGDPGIFGFLGKAVGGVAKLAGKVLPGPVGMVAGAVGGLLTRPKMPASIPQVGTLPIGGGGGGMMLPPSGPGLGGFGKSLIPTVGGAAIGTAIGAAMGGSDAGPGCNAGYRPNKSGYWSNKNSLLPGASWVKPGSTCVKRRRMNPLNPRAMSRAIRRLESAKKAASRLNRISIRGGCGCK